MDRTTNNPFHLASHFALAHVSPNLQQALIVAQQSFLFQYTFEFGLGTTRKPKCNIQVISPGTLDWASPTIDPNRCADFCKTEKYASMAKLEDAKVLSTFDLCHIGSNPIGCTKPLNNDMELFMSNTDVLVEPGLQPQEPSLEEMLRELNESSIKDGIVFELPKPSPKQLAKESSTEDIVSTKKDKWIRTTYCACPKNAPTDCRFHNVKEKGWEICPYLPSNWKETGEPEVNGGRWLYAQN